MRGQTSDNCDAVILGGGLAGLTTGYLLSRTNRSVTLVEREPALGGLARTIEMQGFRFDLGGHRFITRDAELDAFVRELLAGDYLEVDRSSRILLGNNWFHYPLRPLNALSGFGIPTAAKILYDYAAERVKACFDSTPPVSLEDWVVSHYGRRLFSIYFKDYSEKVWGIDCRSIATEWIEQRVQGLSLGVAILNAVMPRFGTARSTLATRFLYPPLGIGQIAERLHQGMRRTSRILNDTSVVRLDHTDRLIRQVTVRNGNHSGILHGVDFVSTIPLQGLVTALHPRPPASVLAAASRLRSRDLVVVAVMINTPRVTEHTWIYLPENNIPFGRIHEPTNWSPRMAPAGKTLLVAEYFCFRGDPTWNRSTSEATRLTVEGLEQLGLIDRRDVLNSVVLRIPNAYPLFEVGYKEHCECIQDYLDRFDNLHVAGRGGAFRYYNMDHAMRSGMDIAARLSTRAALEPTPEPGCVDKVAQLV
jgi:protoporphyrinogen oxidase